MPLYEYRAVDSDGKRCKGVVDADSELLAREKLQRQKHLLLRLRAVGAQRSKRAMSSKLKLAFTRELAQLLQAGLPLYESLVTIEEKYQKQKAHPFFVQVCAALKAGVPFSAILQSHPKTFDGIYLHMVKAAEQTGNLPLVLTQLSELLAKQQRLKKRLLGALIYPAFLGTFCLLLIGSLLFFVVPSLQNLFEGRQLHPLTECVLSLSRFVRNYFHILLLSFGAFTGGLVFVLKRKSGALWSLLLRLKLPLVHTLRIQAAWVQFARAASLLLRGGVPLLKALDLARLAQKWPPLQEAVERAVAKVAEGETLSSEFAKVEWIPKVIPRLLSLAEETGSFAQMFESISNMYEEEVEKSLTHLTALLQPALLLFLGFVVGVVLLSILLPLTDVSSFLSS